MRPSMRQGVMRQATRASRLLMVLIWGLVSVAGSLSAGESRIELRDGSVINGELVSVDQGVYVIQSTNFGQVRVSESDVAAIRPGATGPAAPAAGAGIADRSGDLAALQQQLMGNPQVMESITRLQSDPAIASALADPEFARLILSGDVEALRADPRFQRLLENPAIQSIVGQVLGR